MAYWEMAVWLFHRIGWWTVFVLPASVYLYFFFYYSIKNISSDQRKIRGTQDDTRR